MGKKNDIRIESLKKKHRGLLNKLLSVDEESEDEFDRVLREVETIENRLIHSFGLTTKELLDNSEDCLNGEII